VLTQKHVSNVPVLLYDHKQVYASIQGQCDCACSAPVHTTPADSNVGQTGSQEYVLCPTFQCWPLIDGYYVAVGHTCGAVVLNDAAYDLITSFCTARSLNINLAHLKAQEAYAVLCDLVQLGILQSVHHVAPSPEDQMLSAWLHITDRCNLRCSYCYLPHVSKDMPLDVGYAAIDAAFRSALQHQYTRVKLKYAGGEPLLRFDTIVQLHHYAQQVADESGIMLSGVILSNGTLLEDKHLAKMHQLGLQLMISLDGLGQAHNQQRAYANGQGSFTATERGIKLALQKGITPDISITVTGKNAVALPDLVAWILEHDLPFSLNFYRENEHSASCDALHLEEDQIIAGMRAAYRVIEENLPRRSLLGSLLDRVSLVSPHRHVCGAGHNYLVFDHEGHVSKCQMHMRHSVTDVHIENPLQLIRADALGVKNIPVEEKHECQVCDWKHWCAGGCPLATFRATGRYDVKSPNCAIYKSLFPEVLRLEGLRLLKYFASPTS
jgi:uncharacterized protein